MRPDRALAGLILAVAVVSLVGQFWVFLGLVRAQGGHAGHAIWVYLGFFTILTNGLVALACWFWLRRRWPARGPGAEAGLAALAACIALVGLVYHAVLSKLWNPVGLHFWVDQGLHSAVPALFVLFWAVFAPKAGLRWRDAALWLAYPLAYLGYVLARGAVDGWYPYPFIDAGTLGYARVLMNALVLMAAFYLAGLALVAASRRLPKGRPL